MYQDHLGNEFPSIKAMADHWHIPDSTLNARLKHMSVEQALTCSTDSLRGKDITDHLGNHFSSIHAMCRHYNITTAIYYGRLRCGYDQKEALTSSKQLQPRNSRQVTDHTGHEWPSVSQMCQHWGVKRSAYNARIKAGWSMQDALTKPTTELAPPKQVWTDHEGRQFQSLKDLCDAYGVTRHIFYTRTIKLHWDLKRTLTTPTIIAGDEIEDPFGNTFPTTRDMYNYYNVTESIYKHRTRRMGLSQKEALTRIPKNKMIDDHLTILRCVEWPYHIVRIDGVDDVWTYHQILQYYHQHVMQPVPPTKLQDSHLKVLACTTFPNYHVEIDGKQAVWTYWEIIQYRRDSNYSLSNQKGDAYEQKRDQIKNCPRKTASRTEKPKRNFGSETACSCS